MNVFYNHEILWLFCIIGDLIYMTSKTRMKITDVKLIQLKELEAVGSIEPAWNKGGLMRFTKGGGSTHGRGNCGYWTWDGSLDN